MAKRGRPRKDGTEREELDEHIIIQLRKAVDQGFYEVTFENRKKAVVMKSFAIEALEFFTNCPVQNRLDLQKQYAKSYSDLMCAVPSELGF